MELIMNDFSMTGQFECFDEFQEYFINVFIGILDVIEKKKIPLYKIPDMLTHHIIKDMTLAQILQQKCNAAAMSAFRKKLIILLDNPYLDDQSMQTQLDTSYGYPGRCEEPNCFTEAIERRCPLVSFQHKEFLSTEFECTKDGEGVLLPNVRTKRDLLDCYLPNAIDDLQYIVEQYPFEPKVILAEVNQKCYAKDALLENELSTEDIQKIFKNIPNLLADLLNGRKTHWWESVEKDIFEYRVTISAGREFRVLLFWKESLYFLNGFVKKTQNTPEREKKKARDIVAQIKSTYKKGEK